MRNGLVIHPHPNGDRVWYLNGKLHRVYGPAIIRSDGTQQCGNRISDEYIKEWKNQYNIPTNHENWNDKMLFKLRFC